MNEPSTTEEPTGFDALGLEPSTTEEPTGFDALGLRPELLASLANLGYEEPTPIQRETIPLLGEGGDLLGQAATGTGKTAAFALPILNNIDPLDAPITTALVLVPTRELAVQVSEAMFKYGTELKVKVVPVYGGQPIQRQFQALKRGAHVVVATPGRALDHIRRGSLDLAAVRQVVLDEADEMLDMGFADDIEEILSATPDDRQTILFSATLPPRINSIAKKYQRDPARVQIKRGDADPGTALISQIVYHVNRHHKSGALGRILDVESPTSAIVFCRTRTEVDELTETMNGRGYRAEALHGGMDQKQRDRVMGRLRDGTAELLVATDVAARGLDVDTLTHVVNYDVPSAPESYVHRIGRVGRAGREGIAITLAEPRQKRLLKNIERLTKQTIEVRKIPTVADLRNRQVEQTVRAVTEALASDDLDDYASVLDGLDGVEDDRRIALAAIKLMHEARGTFLDEVEIPDATFRKEKDRHRKHEGKGGKFEKGNRGNGPSGKGGSGGGKPNRANGDTEFVYVSLGRKAGVRPGDLVGAIANEAGLSGKEIGPIRIQENFSVVGVPEGSVDRVSKAVSSTMLRGRKVRVRRYND